MKNNYLKLFFVITSSTLTGLKISLGAALELVEFLHTECNYDYLMTIRLSQDTLEVKMFCLILIFVISWI